MKSFFRIYASSNDGQRIYWLSYGEYKGRRELRPFLRYVEARIEEYNREETYRIYVTRSLQIAPRGESLTKKYYDIVNPRVEEHISGDEIVADVMKRAGLKFG